MGQAIFLALPGETVDKALVECINSLFFEDYLNPTVQCASMTMIMEVLMILEIGLFL